MDLNWDYGVLNQKRAYWDKADSSQASRHATRRMMSQPRVDDLEKRSQTVTWTLIKQGKNSK